MHRSLKRKLVIGLAALAVAALAGGAYAATQSSTPNTRQAFLNDVAKRLHVTPEQLTAALNGATLDQLQAAVKAGQLTQAQANALEQRLKQKGSAAGVPFGFGFGHGGLGPRAIGPRGFGPPPGRLGPFGGLGPFGAAGALPAAASYLGLTTPQLMDQLSGGKSLAQIAGAQHKTVSGLEQAMTTAIKTRLDKLVSNKVITAAQEQKLLKIISARLAKVVDEKGMSFGGPKFRFRGGGAPGQPNAPVPPAYAPVPLPAPSA